jgi:hypothetical protein
MPYSIEVWSHALQGGLIAFLLLFAAQCVYFLVWRQGGKGSLSSQINEAYRQGFRKTSGSEFSALAGPPALSTVYRAWWIALAAAAVITLVLVFTPLTYFPNFSGGSLIPTAGIELKTLNTDLQSDPMKIDGEVTNISGQPLAGFQIHLILYGARSEVAAVRTIVIRRPLHPKQTMPFFFTEPKTDTIKRIGITFSSQGRSLIHRESPEVKQ